MNISPLQKARYDYSPKLPGMLRHGIADICVKEGEATQSVADQDKIKALFPNTYGKNELSLIHIFSGAYSEHCLRRSRQAGWWYPKPIWE